MPELAGPRDTTAPIKPLFSVQFGIGENDLGFTVQSEGFAVNDSGYVAGYYTLNNATAYDHGFIRRLGDSIIDLPQLTSQGTDASSWALAINNSNVAVGWSSTNGTDIVSRAVRWTVTGGVAKVADLGTLPGGAQAEARGINDDGVIVGWSEVQIGTQIVKHAFRRNLDKSKTDLGVLSHDVRSEANDINIRGTVVGTSYSSGGTAHAFAIIGGTMAQLSGGSPSEAFALNDNNDIVGYVTSGGVRKAAVWPGGGGFVLVDDQFAGNARGINNQGEIVGNRDDGGTKPFFRFWSSSNGLGPLYLLPVFPTTLSKRVNGISNRVFASPSSIYCKLAGADHPSSNGGLRAVVWGVSGC